MNSLTKIFSGKSSFLNNVTLFNVVGIFSIAMVNISSYIVGSGYSMVLYFVPIETGEFILNLIIATVSGVFLNGYIYQAVHANFKDDFVLPEMTFKTITTYFKMFPLLIAWAVYFLGFDFIFQNIIGDWSKMLILCLIPFANLLWILFAKDFVFKKQYINPKSLFKIVNKTLVNIVSCAFCSFLLFLTAGFTSLALFKISQSFLTLEYILFFKLLGVCISIYLLYITQLFFNLELSEIVKTKLDNYEI